MSTFSLSGTGVHGLSNNVTAVHMAITTLPAGLPSGRANPTNHFDIGLIRFGDGVGYFAPIAILGGPQWVTVPIGATVVGYSLLNGSVISVTEIIGGPSPRSATILTAPPALMPDILSPESAQCIGVEIAGNGSTSSSSNAWFGSNLSVLIPIRISNQFACTNAFVLSGNLAGGHWDVGVYDDSFALIGHTGSIAQIGNLTLQSSALVLSLAPGKYFLAMAADSTSVTTAVFSLGSAPRARMAGVRGAGSNFPLASAPTLAATPFTFIPYFGLSTYTP